MKLVRFEVEGEARLGAVVDGKIVDLARSSEQSGESSSLLGSSMRAFLTAGEPARSAAERALSYAVANPVGLVHEWDAVRILAPIADPQKIVCVGQNYRDHCEEQNQPLPETAILFSKFPTAINNPGDPIELPPFSHKVDYECELAFVIGKRGKEINEEDAASHIAGYMCLNDISARDIQYGDKQWVRGKTFDTFAPIGPMLVTADEIADPHDLDISLKLNGVTMQSSNTRNLIFGVYYLVSYMSQVFTLEPGDIVTTGTPGGVGVFRNPPVFLQDGDEVSMTISGLGVLTNPVKNR